MRHLVPRNLAVAFLLLAMAACSTDTPTAPQRTPAPPPGSSPSTAWNISVTANPKNLVASDAQPSTITVRVTRAADGTAPVNGTTAVVSVGTGDLLSSGSGTKSIAVTLNGGVAQLLYFAGALLGVDTIQAQLEASVGQVQVNIVEKPVLFIESVSPSSGSEGGGTRIRISGTGFTSPARVTVGGVNATVDAVGAKGDFIRAFTGPVFDPKTFFGTEGCDTDGDGTLDGQRFLPKTVEVTVILTDASVTLANAFTYSPRDSSCRDVTPDPDRPRARFSFTVNGVQVLFNNESTPPGLTFTWLFGDGGTSGEENPIHTYACAAPPCDFDVTLRAVNSSGEDTTTRTVTITTASSPPVANFSFTNAGLDVTFTNLSSGAAPLSFFWDFGDTSTSTATSPMHTYAAPGSYAVTLSATNSSGTASITKTVTVP
jgi:PKD repeat protein